VLHPEAPVLSLRRPFLSPLLENFWSRRLLVLDGRFIPFSFIAGVVYSEMSEKYVVMLNS
jgi:hypothetical protein